MEIDHEIIPLTAQPPRQLEIRGDSREARRVRRHDDRIEMRVPSYNRLRLRFDQVRQVRIGKCPLQRAQQRRGEDDVTDEAQADK